MANSNQDQNMNRRNFIKVAAVTAVAATATGAGAAVFTQPKPPPPSPAPAIPPTPLPPPSVPVVQAVSDPSADTQILMAQLAESQATNMQMQAEVDGLRRELEAAQVREAEQRTVSDDLSIQLAQAGEEVTLLGGLVALYEQLEGVDVGEIVEGGLDSVSTKINELLNWTPELTQGIEAGQLALAEVEAHIPLLDNGRQWLDAQSTKVQGFYEDVEALLQNAVESVGPVLELISDWFEGIKRWLPFGMGQKAADVMAGITNLLLETPGTIAGLDTNVARPLDVWLARENDEVALSRKMIKPIQENVFNKAMATIDQAHQVSTTYQTQLKEPAALAVNTQRTIKQQIAEYRQQYNV